MSALVEAIRDVFGISNDSDVVAAGLREIRDVVGQIRAASATNVDANVRRQWLAHSSFVLDLACERGEGVQGVLTLFCSGAAQVCHDDRVVELKEQLEVEEEDGDRQEEKVEVEREKRVKEMRP